MAWILRTLPLVLVLASVGVATAAPVSGEAEVTEAFSLRNGTLLAGRVDAVANRTDAVVAVADARLVVAEGATVIVCPDRAGGSAADRLDEARGTDCPDGQRYERARLDLVRGGVALWHEGARARVANLGYAAPFADPDAGAQGVRVPWGLLLAGGARVEADASTFAFRLLGDDATVRVRGSTTFPERHTGENFTVHVLGAPDGYALFTPGAAVATNAWTGSVSPAPRAQAEAGFDRTGLLELERILLPAARVDRPLDLAYASGPFELVPATLNGMLAFRGNLTLDGAPATGAREAIVVGGARADLAWRAGHNLTFEGDARWSYRAGALVTGAGQDPGSSVVPGLFGGLALVGVVLEVRTRRHAPLPEGPRVWRTRVGVLLLAAAAAAVALVRVGALFEAPLFTEWGTLHARTRVQLTLLAAVVGALALAVGAPGLWLLTRNLARRRLGRPARSLGFLAALAGTLLVLGIALPTLVTWAMRIVRL